MLLLHTSVKVFIDVIMNIALILLVKDELFNDSYFLKFFKLVNIALSYSIELLFMILDQLRGTILLAQSDIEIKAKTQG
jgi:hypothetical protein